MKVTVYCDGASENIGGQWYGTVGFVLMSGNTTLAEDGFPLQGEATCNDAEWSALYWALRKAIDLGVTEAEVFMDSQLVAYGASRKWKVKKQRQIAEEVWALLSAFEYIKFNWIPREQNWRADEWTQKAWEEFEPPKLETNNYP